MGRDGAEVASSAFVLSWDGTAVVQKPLPDVPVPLGKMPGVAALGDVVYVTGSNVLWRIDLASDAPRWEEAREVAGLPAVFGEQPVLVAQKGRLFLFPGYDARAGRALSARFGKTFVGASAVAVGDQHRRFGTRGVISERAAYADFLMSIWSALEAGDAARADDLFAKYLLMMNLSETIPGGHLRGFNLYVLKRRGIFRNLVSRDYVTPGDTSGKWKLETRVFSPDEIAAIEDRLSRLAP